MFPRLTAAVLVVSTHSRPKAAGKWLRLLQYLEQFQHTAARRRLAGNGVDGMESTKVSTHSRPKAAGLKRLVWVMTGVFQHTAARRRLDNLLATPFGFRWFQHTAARRRLACDRPSSFFLALFQHTAARRRLGQKAPAIPPERLVSTHSRPKAAGNHD